MHNIQPIKKLILYNIKYNLIIYKVLWFFSKNPNILYIKIYSIQFYSDYVQYIVHYSLFQKLTKIFRNEDNFLAEFYISLQKKYETFY